MDVSALTITSAIENYLQFIALTRSANRALTYRKALREFKKLLVVLNVDPENTLTTDITEDMIPQYILHLNVTSATTEQLYVGVVARFLKYLVGKELSSVNLPRMELLLKQHARKAPAHLPKISTKAVERTLNFVSDDSLPMPTSKADQLRMLRDRAFLLTLADTGLRVSEACKLRLENVDWIGEQAVIIGKGDKQAVVRFTSRAIRALKDYLSLRAELDGGSGKQLTALPLFARHDKGTGKKIEPITPTTGRNIVAERVKQALGDQAEGHITPHSFRHYFVSTILKASGNLKLAQALARHENIQITQRYAHINDDELDKGYYEIFEKKP
jgi:site-specific recombinase XerD